MAVFYVFEKNLIKVMKKLNRNYAKIMGKFRENLKFKNRGVILYEYICTKQPFYGGYIICVQLQCHCFAAPSLQNETAL